jgi:hypothetical protein
VLPGRKPLADLVVLDLLRIRHDRQQGCHCTSVIRPKTSDAGQPRSGAAGPVCQRSDGRGRGSRVTLRRLRARRLPDASAPRGPADSLSGPAARNPHSQAWHVARIDGIVGPTSVHIGKPSGPTAHSRGSLACHRPNAERGDLADHDQQQVTSRSCHHSLGRLTVAPDRGARSWRRRGSAGTDRGRSR